MSPGRCRSAAVGRRRGAAGRAASGVLCLLVSLAASGCGGGGKRAYITRYPDWNWQEYERLAVVPFRPPPGQPQARAAAAQATDLLADLLATNGNFTVLERSALKDVLTEQDLSQLADVADPSTVLPPGRIQVAQALVVGKLTTFEARRERFEKRYPVFARDRRGRIRRDRNGRPIVVRQEVVPYFRHKATVGGSVRVIDAATGRVIFAHHVAPITREATRRGAPPEQTPEALALAAVREVAGECYARIAPVNTAVKLKSDMLIVALDYYDGEYDKTSKVSSDREDFLLVVRDLPRECARNSFRVAIAPEDGRNVFEQEFVWSGDNPARGQVFRVPVALLKSAGQEEFEAKLYSGSGEEPLLKRDFKLELPDED